MRSISFDEAMHGRYSSCFVNIMVKINLTLAIIPCWAGFMLGLVSHFFHMSLIEVILGSIFIFCNQNKKLVRLTLTNSLFRV